MIHPTAVLEGDICLPEDGSVEIGPYAVLRGAISIGSGCRIAAHACIEGWVTMGDNNTVCQGAVLGGDPQDLSFSRNTRSGLRIGSGNTFREHVTIHRGSKDDSFTTVGDRNFLMAGCHLGHDVTVGDGNVIANNVLFGGHVSLGNNTFLGGASVYHQFIRIGSGAMVQGHGGFSKDIPPYVIAHGVNSLAGLNVVGLRRAGVSAERRMMLKKAFDLLHSDMLPFEDLARLADSPEWTNESAVFFAFFRHPSRKGICR